MDTVATDHEPAPTRESAKKAIDNLKSRLAAANLGAANEAVTRLQVVDEVLEQLGWSKAEFNPEQAAGGAGFTDYALSIDEHPRVVVEAKRLGLTFSASRQRLKKVEYSLGYLRSAFGDSLSEVVTQAAAYCVSIGVPYAILTNGAEWILFQAFSVRGTPAEDLRGFYFGNLLGESFQFDFLWDLISRRAVASGALDEHLAELNAQECEFTRAPQDAGCHPAHLTSVKDDALDELYRRFFGGMTDAARRTMMERCFVTSSKLDQQRKELERVLRDAKPAYLPADAISLEPGGEVPVFDSAGDARGRVVLITGSVGCGKSTLVAKTVWANRDRAIITLVVDLIDEDDQEEEWLWESVFLAWQERHAESTSYEQLKLTFRHELNKLRRGPRSQIYEEEPSQYTIDEATELERLLKNRSTFIPKCWKRRKAQGTGIMVFLDNVDRTSEGFQKKVYRFAHKLAKSSGATVAVTMREVSYFRGKSSFLDVRSDDVVVHLEAPDLSKVIARRVDYLENHVELDHRYKTWRASSGWDELYARFVRHAQVLRNTFVTSPEAPRRVAIVAATAWHDVRLFLTYLKRIHSKLGSESGPWEQSSIVAALVQRDGDTSPLPNVFRPALPTHPAHFLKLRMLFLLQGATVTQGVEQERLLRCMTAYGYQRRWGRAALQEMVRERLVECLELPAALEVSRTYTLDPGHTFRLSPVGALILSQLCEEPAYLALGGFSLPFHRESLLDEFVELARLVLDCSAAGEERDVVTLFSEDGARVVVRYLRWALEKEQAYDAAKNALPDVASVEVRLRTLIEAAPWDSSARDSDPPSRSPPQMSDVQQLLPLAELGNPPGEPTELRLAIPAALATARIGQSSLAPMILWALVYFRAHGKNLVQGAQVTEAINTHVAEEGAQKAAPNVSRALRQQTLRSQKWLQVQHDTHGKRPCYGLKPCWREAWREVFSEPAPNVP